MKVIKKVNSGIQQVFSTNVKNNHNYISENGIVNHNCVVDEGYAGEVHIHLFNDGHDAVLLEPGMKIVQFVLVRVGNHDVCEIGEAEYKEHMDKLYTRGEGAFGSTGEK